eukprot:7553683-Alexandrium_andersonii.AAC.1
MNTTAYVQNGEQRPKCAQPYALQPVPRHADGPVQGCRCPTLQRLWLRRSQGIATKERQDLGTALPTTLCLPRSSSPWCRARALSVAAHVRMARLEHASPSW